jgi:hypothetical protein
MKVIIFKIKKTALSGTVFVIAARQGQLDGNLFGKRISHHSVGIKRWHKYRFGIRVVFDIRSA